MVDVAVMSMSQFAVAHSNPADWERDGDEMVVYRSDHGRVRISFEKHCSLEYVGKSIGYRDDHPVDYSKVFADDLIAAIRGQLSAHDIHMLLLRLTRELSDWQFEPGFEKREDVCGEAAKDIGGTKGFENKDPATAIKVARQYRAAEIVPEPIVLQGEIESLRQYEEMVMEACGEMETSEECGVFLRALVSQQGELARDAARYKKLRRLNVPQFQELYQINIKSGMPFDHLVDELP